MATMFDCIQTAIDAGEIDKVRGREAQTAYSQLYERYRSVYPDHQAQVLAATDIKEATRRATRARFHSVVAQLQAMRRIKQEMDSARDPGVTLRNFIEYSEGSGYTGESVVSVRDALISDVNFQMRENLKETGANLIGKSKNEARLADMINEAEGYDTSDLVAKEYARALDNAQDGLLRQFNALGGDIKKLDNYGVPHSHDQGKLLKAGREPWKADITKQLDWSRIDNRSTGKPFVAEAGEIPRGPDVDKLLDEVYASVTTKGWNKQAASMSVGGKALYNQRAEPRNLHFLIDGKAWLDYNAKYGASNPFDAMMNGLHGMAGEIAQMKVLGPNPRAGLEFAAQLAERRVALELADAAGNPKALKLAQENVQKVKDLTYRTNLMLDQVDGSANYAVNQYMANFFGGTRALLTATQLGSATISAITDTVTMSMAAQTVGMGGAKVLVKQAELIASSASREEAARMGFVASSIAQTQQSSSRYFADTWNSEFTNRVSGFTLRASLLNHWTDMARVAWQSEFAGWLAGNAMHGFDTLNKPLRRTLEARGITAADWDVLRDPRFFFTADNGATFLAPGYWRQAARETLGADKADALATRLQMLIEEHVEIAVPSVSVEGRTMFVTAPPGTLTGELQRSTVMYKTFAVSLSLRQYRRFLNIPTPLGRVAYAAKLSTGLLMMGALAIQLKEIAKGRDPRPMGDPSFWMAAMFQGGGLGIFGDFFNAQTSRAGGGIGDTIAGPVLGLYQDVTKPLTNAYSRALDGRRQNVGRDVSKLLRRNTPVASSLWYGRLAFDRMVADQVQDFLDPQASVAWNRAERRALRDYGTRSYWPRGSLTPERLPDFSNIAGTK